MNPPGQLVDDLRLLEAPIPWWMQPWVGALATLLVVGGLFLLWRKLRGPAAGGSAAAAAAEADTAWEDALAELKRLFALIDSEQSRPYAIESSAILRRYLERRFGLRAPLRSTEEFLREAQQSPKLTGAHRGLLGEFLRCCDLLKFGRGLATKTELHGLQGSAIEFVTATRPQPAAQEAVA